MSLTLSNDQISFIESDVSLSAASRDRRYLPSVARVLACQANPEGTHLHIWFSRTQGKQLLQDSLDGGHIALAVSHPPTHKTWQIKGKNVRELPVDSSALALIQKHIRDFSRVVEALGFAPGFAEALYAHEPNDLVCLCFEPETMFDQTPGPNAGNLLCGESAS